MHAVSIEGPLALKYPPEGGLDAHTLTQGGEAFVRKQLRSGNAEQMC